METFQISQLSFTYPGQARPALDHISLCVEEGAFLVLCGQSGCGKTTLLRQLKPALTPHGTQSGQILFQGRPLRDLGPRQQSGDIGFVMQSPDNQLVTDKVWHELAFGLESLGLDTPTIRRRVAEMASFFGIESWFHRDVAELSGGQKQLLNLAAVMVMQPKVLLLDEPTSQLDPIAAEEFLSVLGRINRDLGTTVILSEHRLEEALPLATAAAVLDGGRLLAAGPPRQVGQTLKDLKHPMFRAMPAPARIWAAVDTDTPCPFTVREGRNWLSDFSHENVLRPLPPEKERQFDEIPALEARELWFRYEKEGPDVLRGLSLTVGPGEFLALLGGNGAGKSTALSLMAGVNRPQRGTIERRGRLALLPQDPQTLFLKKTVREDLMAMAPKAVELERVAALCRLEGLLDRHPYDLSGGEQQRAALAKVLLCRPRILLLDEPTKGLDTAFQDELAQILAQLLEQNVAVVMVSHDIAFCARYAHRCILIFDGAAAAEGTPRQFFSGNSFYTTAASRMAREVIPQAVTAEDVIFCCGGTVPKEPERRPPPEHLPDPPGEGEKPEQMPPPSKKALSRRTRLTVFCLLLLVPVTLFAGSYFWKDRNYYVISLLILLECILPFFLVFEGRKPSAREVTVLASLCALGVAGRAAFFMLPQFKPVLALTILSGAALGAESGFLVGAMTMLASNMLFSQGPWTPWQMFGMGIIGFLAGILFRTGPLRPRRNGLCVFGALSAVVVYGGILNASSAILAGGGLNGKILLTYYLSGLPMDCVHAFATALFLWFGAEPMLEKLERIKTKYGLL